jgi:hypothetical protein
MSFASLLLLSFSALGRIRQLNSEACPYMDLQLIIPVVLETVWLVVLWLCIPETRPWEHQTPFTEEPLTSRVSLLRTWLLYIYVIWHIPIVLIAWVFNFVDFKHVRPRVFLLLGASTGAIFTLRPLLRP